MLVLDAHMLPPPALLEVLCHVADLPDLLPAVLGVAGWRAMVRALAPCGAVAPQPDPAGACVPACSAVAVARDVASASHAI